MAVGNNPLTSASVQSRKNTTTKFQFHFVQKQQKNKIRESWLHRLWMWRNIGGTVIIIFFLLAFLVWMMSQGLGGVCQLLVVLVSFTFLMVTPTGADQDAKRLYEDLLTDYNRLIRPVGNNSDRLTVKLGLKLSQLIDVVINDLL